MQNTLNIIRNHLEPDIIETHVSDKNIIEMLMAAFDDKLPPHVRIYHESVVFENDVTPFVDDLGNVSIDDIEYLLSLEGEFWAVYRPDQDPFSWIMAGLVVLSLVATFLFKPKIPNVSIRNTTAESPNNSLSNRENAARPRARVPDIYGQVRCTPDLIAVPLRYYINHNEYELSYMCVGRGEYEIARLDSLGDAATEAQKRYDIRESETLVQAIPGTQLEVYAPYTRPGKFSEANFTIKLNLSPSVFTVTFYVEDNNTPIPSAVRKGTGTLVLGDVSGLSWVDDYTPPTSFNVLKSIYSDSVSPKWECFLQIPDSTKINGISELIIPDRTFEIYLHGDPILKIPASGYGIEETIYTVVKIDSVDGQTLNPGISSRLQGNADIRLEYPGIIRLSDTSDNSFTDFFSVGSTINLINSFSLAGLTQRRENDTYASQINISADYGIGYFDIEGSSSELAAGMPLRVPEASVQIVRDSTGEYGGYVVLESFNLIGFYYIESSTSIGNGYRRVKVRSAELVNTNWLKFNKYKSDPSVRLNCTGQHSWVYSGSVPVSYDGAYTVNSVLDKEMVLDSPETINPAWGTLTQTEWFSPLITSEEGNRVGYFMINMPTMQMVLANFVAMQGLYKDDGINQRAVNVELAIELTPCALDGTPIGEPEVFTDTIMGTGRTRDMRALTMRIKPNFSGRCLVRAWRISPTDTSFQGTVVDEIKWKDLYGLAQVDKEHFGNKTTVLVQTKATTGALSLKGRKLNMLVTRKLPRWQGGTIFTEALYPTKNAADIISAISLDPHIGDCSLDEVDFTQLYDTMDEIEEYFGNIEATEFCYTFDKKLSYEETVQAIAEAIFCNAYRRGGVIRLFFDKKRDISSIVLNHRNKIPGTEKRNIKFGIKDNRDGVSYQWVNPENNDNLETLYIRNGVIGEIPINPEPIESIGVRNYRQAYWHLMRAWNRLKYQHTTVEVDAIGQAELTMVGDKITCADNTRASVQDGEIEGYEPLKLITSQPVAFETGVPYTVFIQLPNGTVQAIEAFPVTGDDYAIALASAPAILPVTDDTAVNKSTYVLSKSTDKDYNYFIVADRTQGENNVSNLKLINYDERYYSGDPDPYAGVAGYGYNYGNYYGGFYG